MTADPSPDHLQKILLEAVFADKLTPQAAAAKAIREHPDAPLLTWVFVLTNIAVELQTSFVAEENWSYADWLEAAASLGCDIYALDAMGHARPRGHDLAALWAKGDPHLI
ncbi:MAG: hypothetical protein AAF841_05355 [Pseudomonadota bacterium]